MTRGNGTGSTTSTKAGQDSPRRARPGSQRAAAPNRAGSDDPAGDFPLPENYEAAREELAVVVERLEAGGLTLDESLALWERGQALAEVCEKFLAGARKRVEAVLAGREADDHTGHGDEDEADQEPG